MSKPAQPDELARLRGSAKKHPERYRNSVPKSDLPCGEPPETMTEEAQECWWEISVKVITGVLTFADTLMLEVASNLLTEYRTNPVEFPIGKYTHLIGTLGRFGMSPSDRTKIGVVKPEVDEDDFE
jgi:hypothetical protein